MLNIKDKLFVEGNEEIILKGVAIPDIYWLKEKESQNPKEVIKTIKNIGFNTVRIPVLPGHFRFYENYLKETILPIVEECKNLDLYAILDWHAIGNPLHNETRLQKYYHEKNNEKIYWYEANGCLAKLGISALVDLFGEYDNVLFEIFNEPAPGEKSVSQLSLSGLPWVQLKAFLDELILIIRAKSKNVILVSSNYWSYNLKSTSTSLFTEYKNIAYTFHCYPIRNNQNWKEMLTYMKKVPVIVTEWGYDAEKKDSTYFGTREEYGIPFLEYMLKNKLSFTAWCFSASWRPRILKSWNNLDLSDFGNLLIQNITFN